MTDNFYSYLLEGEQSKELKFRFEYYTVIFSVSNGNLEEKAICRKDTEEHKRGDIITARGKEAVLDFLSPNFMDKFYEEERYEGDAYSHYVTQKARKKLTDYVLGIEDKIQAKAEELRKEDVYEPYKLALKRVYDDIEKDKSIPELEDFDKALIRKGSSKSIY